MDEVETTGSYTNLPEKDKETKKKWISCIPKVIKDGVLITAAAALILAGCATISKYSYVIGDILPGVAVEQREERAKKDGWEVEYDAELEAYILKSYIDQETGEKIIVCTTNDELKAYFPERNQNPTYEDVRETIYQNDKIPLEYKLTYCAGLKILLEKMPNLDLFTLNLNAERVSVEEVSEVEGKQYLAGDYNSNTGVIRYIDKSDRTVLHEFLGHAMVGGRFETDDGIKVEKYFKVPMCLINYLFREEADYYSILLTGRMTEEYIANEIASSITGERFTGSYGYTPTSWHMKMYSSACDVELEDLINEGVISFAKKMYKDDIDKPLDVFLTEDMLYVMHKDYGCDKDLFSMEGLTIDGLATEFFIDWSEEKFKRGEKGVIEKAVSCIQNAGYEEDEEITYINGQNPDESEHITPQELINIVQTELADLEDRTTSSIESDWDYIR